MIEYSCSKHPNANQERARITCSEKQSEKLCFIAYFGDSNCESGIDKIFYDFTELMLSNVTASICPKLNAVLAMPFTPAKAILILFTAYPASVKAERIRWTFFKC